MEQNTKKPTSETPSPKKEQEEAPQVEEVLFPTPADDALFIMMSTDIIDKQYRLYSWADSKTLSLITTNSILLATIGFLFKECYSDTFSMITILIAFSLIGISLYYSLIQVIPQGSSGKSKGTVPNLRALSGITSYKKWQDYHLELLKIDKKKLYEFYSRQIFGMATNIDKSRNITKKGVIFTTIGIGFLLLSVAGVSFSSKGINIFGKWQTINVLPVLDTTSVQNKKDTIIEYKHDTVIYTPKIIKNIEKSSKNKNHE